MERDLRETPLYQEIEAAYRRLAEPGFGRITHADDVRASPDGSAVAFRGARLDALEGHASGRICLAAADGSGMRQVTHGPNEDSGPRWSPDGTTLTFLSDRAAAGSAQLYALETGVLGEARPLTEAPGVVEHHEWSPDGSRILLLVAGQGAEQTDALGSGTLGTQAEVPDWVPLVSSTEGEGDGRRSVYVLDVASGELAQASAPALNVWEASWCGDRALVAIVSEGAGEGAWYGAELALIDPAARTARTLRRTDVQLGWACGSPGGTRAAVIEAVCSDRTIVAGDLLLVDTASGETRTADTRGVDVSWSQWRDEERLFAIGLRGLEPVALEVRAADGTAEQIWVGSGACGASFYPAGSPIGQGRAFAAIVESWDRAPSVVIADGAKETTLADLAHAGTDARTAAIGERRRLRWSAPDGLEIEGFLTLPRGEPPFPTILLVHGGPIGAFVDVPPRGSVLALIERGYAIFGPNVRGSAGRGREFAALVVGDMGGGDVGDMLSGLDELVGQGVADPERLGVMGLSYGGFMACWLPTQDPRFRAAVAMSPVSDWYSERFGSNLGAWVGDFLDGEPKPSGGQYFDRSPVLFAHADRTPTLLTAGMLDLATPPGQAIEFHNALAERGVPTDVAIYPGEGHGVHSFPALIDCTTRVVAWFERHMPVRS
ncbi:MAG TPA: S9 family peptidase [Gaiellales bacterium]|jgi:dipeptidyl aminopeptidase/acylaminoacyl peptidase|nr:S9 family peptidase [Gaiellales bacterium]